MLRAIQTLAWAKPALGSIRAANPVNTSQPSTTHIIWRGMAALKQPKRTKYRKMQKGRVNELPVKSNVAFGEFGLRVMEPCKIKASQLESVRATLARLIKPYKGRLWLRVFPDIPVSSKPAEVRMGKGKGAVDHWVARVRPQRIIVEIGAVPEEAARAALKQAAYKLGVETKFVARNDAIPASVLARPLALPDLASPSPSQPPAPLVRVA